MMGQFLVTGAGTGIGTIASGEETAVRIYPNPFTDFFTMEIPGANSAPATIDILTSTGQLCLHQIISVNPVTIDASDLTQGMYFVRITNQDKIWLKKVIRQ